MQNRVESETISFLDVGGAVTVDVLAAGGDVELVLTVRLRERRGGRSRRRNGVGGLGGGGVLEKGP